MPQEANRFPSARGRLYTVVLAALFLLLAAGCVASILFMQGAARIVFTLIYLLVAALLVWMYVSTYYELREHVLYVHAGPFSEEIPYDRIRSAVKCRGYAAAMALDTARIELVHGRSSISGRTQISPMREDEFLAQLAQRSPNITLDENSSK